MVNLMTWRREITKLERKYHYELVIGMNNGSIHVQSHTMNYGYLVPINDRTFMMTELMDHWGGGNSMYPPRVDYRLMF